MIDHHPPTVPLQVTMLEEKVNKLTEEKSELWQEKASTTERMLNLTTKADEASEEAARHKKDLATAQEELATAQTTAEERGSELSENFILLEERTKKLEELTEQHRALRLAHEELKMEHEQLVNRWVTKSQELAVHQNELNEAKLQLAAEKAQLELLRSHGGGGAGMISLDDIDPNFLMPGFVGTQIPNKFKTRFDCHASDCLSVQYNSATGTQFITASADKTVKLFQAVSGDNIATLSGARAGCTAASFSADDSLILSCSADQSVRVHTASTQRSKFTLNGHKDKVMQALCTPDTKKVISASRDRTVKIWDLSRGSNVGTVLSHSYINDLALHDQGEIAVTAHSDGYVRWWDLRTTDEIAKIELHSTTVTSICTSLCGDKLLTACRDNTIKVVDARMHRELLVLRHPDFMNTFDSCRARLSPDGNYAVAGSSSGSVHIWDLKKGMHHSILKDKKAHDKAISCVAWSPSGNEILSCDKGGAVVKWFYGGEGEAE